MESIQYEPHTVDSEGGTLLKGFSTKGYYELQTWKYGLPKQIYIVRHMLHKTKTDRLSWLPPNLKHTWVPLTI